MHIFTPFSAYSPITCCPHRFDESNHRSFEHRPSNLVIIALSHPQALLRQLYMRLGLILPRVQGGRGPLPAVLRGCDNVDEGGVGGLRLGHRRRHGEGLLGLRHRLECTPGGVESAHSRWTGDGKRSKHTVSRAHSIIITNLDIING